MHWVKLKDISQVKGKGGLGFRDIEAVNLSSLAKQGWTFFKVLLLVS